MTNQMCNYHMFYVSHNGAYPFQQKEMWKYTKICDSSTINHDLLSDIALLWNTSEWFYVCNFYY